MNNNQEVSHGQDLGGILKRHIDISIKQSLFFHSLLILFEMFNRFYSLFYASFLLHDT